MPAQIVCAMISDPFLPPPPNKRKVGSARLIHVQWWDLSITLGPQDVWYADNIIIDWGQGSTIEHIIRECGSTLYNYRDAYGKNGPK